MDNQKPVTEKELSDLKEILMTRMNGMELLTEERFKTSQLAIDKAEEAQKQRNMAANEWREAMNDREINFTQKVETLRIMEDIKLLRTKADNATGRNSILTVVITTGISLAFFFLSYLLK
jgi:hypothetical protein